MVYNWYIKNTMNIMHKLNFIPVGKEKNIKKFFMFLYYTITKLFVILIINLLLHTFKEALVLCLFFMLLRGFAQGIHAKKNSICWLVTLSIFIPIPLLIKYLVIHKIFLYIAYPIMIINYLLFSPNDTQKRSMKNKFKRISFKIIGTIIVTSFFVYTILYQNHLIIYSMFYSSIIALISFHPLTYKLFGQHSYNYRNL